MPGEIDEEVTADRAAIRELLMRGEHKRQTKTKETDEGRNQMRTSREQ